MILGEATNEEWRMRFGGIEQVPAVVVPFKSEVAANDSRCQRSRHKIALKVTQAQKQVRRMSGTR